MKMIEKIKENKKVVKRVVIIGGITVVGVTTVVLYKKGLLADVPVEELIEGSTEALSAVE